MTQNQIAYLNYQETVRSNLAREGETNRSNLAREMETNRSNLVNEGVSQAKQVESERANRVTEALIAARDAETARSNKAREAETHRSNVADESYQLTKLTTDSALRTAELAEESRHNLAVETLKGSEIAQKAAKSTSDSIVGFVDAIIPG